MNVRTKLEVRSFTHSWDNRGYSKNLGSPWIRLFSQIFYWAFVLMDPVNVSAKFAVRIALPVSEIIALAVFELGLRTPILGKGRPYGVGDGTVRKSVAKFLFLKALHSTFHLSSCISEILPLLCFSTTPFPTPPLVSPKFPHVPLWLCGWPLGCEERRCWANCPCN